MKYKSFFKTISILLLSLSISKSYGQPVNFTGLELLSRPTNSSIMVSIVADQALDAYVEYGLSPATYNNQSGIISALANEPLKIVLTGLQGNTKYYYRIQFRLSGTVSWTARAENSFRTQRTAGSSFQFAITSDSHINVGGLGTPATWLRTLTNVKNDNPDFLIDCGDTYSMDNVNSVSTARASYLFQRTAANLGFISGSVPIFLAVGNHEQQEAWHLNDNGNPVNSQPVWGTNAQKRFFPNPTPDGFYLGDTATYFALDGDQLREDYYAWTWGNALFVVISPYWFTTQKPFIGNTGGGEPGASDGDRWRWTLGQTQYNWLRQTLENSNAQYKFLFMHHMTGGTEDYIRGGAYAAPFCEWGGFNEDGITNAFNTRRPGWYAPVHQVLVENHVSAVFHGHDHQYGYEIRDGVVYHAIPAAGIVGNGFNIYNETNPLTIRVLPSPGHLRVTVSPSSATVEYVSSNIATNGQVSHSYTIAPFVGSSVPVLMKSFTVQVEKSNKVSLKWKTVSEFRNKHFNIQRAIPSGGFIDIATVAATNSPTGADYSYIDDPRFGGKYLYRLSMVDLDGKKTYSETRLANLNGKYWRITEDGSNWHLWSDQQIRYSVLDLQGRLITQGSFTGSKAITKPSSGSIYLLKVICNGEVITQKLLK